MLLARLHAEAQTSSLPSLADRRRSPASSRCSPPGMFEYNFGDSEFLMLFLVLVTLPYAADRVPASTAPAVEQRRAA